jgi:prepilin-type N-terminal cleavage/methylation domain-containing protein
MSLIEVRAMRRSPTSARQGFTLTEILIALVVLGILAGLGIPNLLSTFSKNNVKGGLGTVQNALQDAQRQALRTGKQCTVQLGRAAGSTSTYFDRLRATPVGCFVTGSNIQVESLTVGTTTTTYQTLVLPTGIKVSDNLTADPPIFQFSFKGHLAGYSALAATGQIPTLVVFAVDPSTDAPFTSNQHPKRCLMASSMLGLLRTGNYINVTSATNLAPTNITSNNCNPAIDGRGS